MRSAESLRARSSGKAAPASVKRKPSAAIESSGRSGSSSSSQSLNIPSVEMPSFWSTKASSTPSTSPTSVPQAASATASSRKTPAMPPLEAPRQRRSPICRRRSTSDCESVWNTTNIPRMSASPPSSFTPLRKARSSLFSPSSAADSSRTTKSAPSDCRSASRSRPGTRFTWISASSVGASRCARAKLPMITRPCSRSPSPRGARMPRTTTRSGAGAVPPPGTGSRRPSLQRVTTRPLAGPSTSSSSTAMPAASASSAPSSTAPSPSSGESSRPRATT